MVYYCSTSDVGSRLGLNNAQRTQAGSKLTAAIRRASIDIDQEFRDYGRDVPSRETAETTLDGAHSTTSTVVDLTAGGAFGVPGSGNIDGDSFAWTGRAGNQLTGVTGISADHAGGVTVQQGEMAHILREIGGDLAAAYYMEDEGTFFIDGESIRGNLLRERGTINLRRLAHLGSVD